MNEKDRGGLGESPFSYRDTKDGKVFLFFRGTRVMTLKGRQARAFLRRMVELEDDERQLAMAKITGNFKRGNERAG